MEKHGISYDSDVNYLHVRIYFWRDIDGFHTNTNKGDNIAKKRRRGPCIYTIPLKLLSAENGQEARWRKIRTRMSEIGDQERGTVRSPVTLLREHNFVL
jgi:hypothetical protein